MGFMSAGLSGFIQGAAGQANANYAEAGKEQDVLLQRQQAMIDRVAADNDGMRKQAQNIALKQNSYKGQYNIPDDLAYTLATDDSFDKMDPDKRADYVARLKPTGNYTQPSQAVPDKTIPGFQQDRGILGGGKINVPSYTVPNSGSPPIPGRQIYSPTPPQPDVRKDYGTFPVPSFPGQADAQYRVSTANVKGGTPPAQEDIELAYRRDPKEVKSNAMTKTIDLIAAGHVDTTNPNAAQQIYEGLGGKRGDFDWGLIAPKVKGDPVFLQKVSAAEDMGIPHELAVKNAIGALHVSRDPTTGVVTIVDGFTGKPVDYDNANKLNVINNGPPGGQSPQPSQPSQQNNNTSSPQQQPNQQQPAVPQQQSAIPTTNTGAIQDQTVHPQPQGWVTKPVYDQVSKEITMAPTALAKIHYIQSLLDKNPSAVGVPGNVIEYIGGPLVTLGNIVGGMGTGTAIDKWAGVSNTKEFRAAMDDLRASMPRPITQDQTGGRISNYEREQIATLFSDTHWADSPQSTARTLGYVQNLMYRTLASNLNAIYPTPSDLQTNQQAQASRFSFLTKQLNLSSGDAYNILAQEVGVKQGKGLQ